MHCFSTRHKHRVGETIYVVWLIVSLLGLIILSLPAFICIMSILFTIMELNLWFINYLITWMTIIWILTSSTSISTTTTTSTSIRTYSSTSWVIPPLPLLGIIDDCVKNAFYNDIFDLFNMCSLLMRESCSSSKLNW